MNRLRELDFLRGAAIILVLFRHQYLFSFTHNMGWIGVDLFFVLSGFLVSGLLFKEYLKFGDIQPKRFLIRRGFKIYPIYFIFYVPYLLAIIKLGTFELIPFLSDMAFIQNYVNGWGYAYPASWSLAVEEHFYFGLCFVLWYGIKYKKTFLANPAEKSNKTDPFQKFIIATLIICLCLRVVSNIVFPLELERNFTMTHLRIDSLLAGVYISYLYYFKREQMTENFNKYKNVLLLLAVLGVCWTPFIDPTPSFFAKTIGFTLLYVSFGIVLMYFLLVPTINQKLNSVLGSVTVNIVSKIGYCSYSIYIIHSLINKVFNKLIESHHFPENHYLVFLTTSFLSVVIGMVMTYKIEDFFLKIRNKYVASRV